MRTTVDIPDGTYRQLKTRALEEGTTIKELVLKGVEVVLREPTRRKVRRLKGPILTGGVPGSLKMNLEKAYDLIDFP